MRNKMRYLSSSFSPKQTKKRSKKIKRTKIKYQNISDKLVKIIGIENCAREVDMPNDVYRVYTSDVPYYEGHYHVSGVLIQKDEGAMTKSNPLTFFKGDVLLKKDFREIISAMKAAGHRLHAIRQGIKNAETKTITI